MFLCSARQQVSDDGALADIGGCGAVEAQLARRRIDGTRALDSRLKIRFRGLHALREHIGAASDFAAHQPAFAQQLIGSADSADSRADVVGQVALRRQFCTGIDDAFVDI